MGVTVSPVVPAAVLIEDGGGKHLGDRVWNPKFVETAGWMYWGPPVISHRRDILWDTPLKPHVLCFTPP